MAFASDAADRTAHAPTDGNREQGWVFDWSFTLAKTFSAAFSGHGFTPYQCQPRRTGTASHTDPGRDRGPRPGAPRAPADR